MQWGSTTFGGSTCSLLSPSSDVAGAVQHVFDSKEQLLAAYEAGCLCRHTTSTASNTVLVSNTVTLLFACQPVFRDIIVDPLLLGHCIPVNSRSFLSRCLQDASRSHCVVTFVLTRNDKVLQTSTVSRMSLVDLGGTDRVGQRGDSGLQVLLYAQCV